MTDLRQWLQDRCIDADTAIRAGVRYDRRRDAIAYPRIGLDGERIGWKYRGLSGDWISTEPSGIKHKDTLPWTVIDGGGDTLCLCEGETDALALATNISFLPLDEDARVVAIPGATTFPNEWAGLFAKYNNVYLFPDPDSAGEDMVKKVCGLIARTKVVRLDARVGDLNKNIQSNLLGTRDAILDANPVFVDVPLRRVGYDFQRSHDIPNHILVDVVARDTHLKKVGQELYAICPFPDHNDTNRSFTLNPDKGVFNCYGCKRRGDIISYFIERDGVDFKSAKRKAESLR